ncbi:hypothetical protein [Brevibacterium litoralis]|uniref:hypothetical protein n=1 Tax=Brevibacterium litoralis TaxID=3138935 RepID=UPI0032EFACD2
MTNTPPVPWTAPLLVAATVTLLLRGTSVALWWGVRESGWDVLDLLALLAAGVLVVLALPVQAGYRTSRPLHGTRVRATAWGTGALLAAATCADWVAETLGWASAALDGALYGPDLVGLFSMASGAGTVVMLVLWLKGAPGVVVSAVAVTKETVTPGTVPHEAAGPSARVDYAGGRPPNPTPVTEESIRAPRGTDRRTHRQAADRLGRAEEVPR